jgi:hypothetical protein
MVWRSIKPDIPRKYVLINTASWFNGMLYAIVHEIEFQ